MKKKKVTVTVHAYCVFVTSESDKKHVVKSLDFKRLVSTAWAKQLLSYTYPDFTGDPAISLALISVMCTS